MLTSLPTAVRSSRRLYLLNRSIPTPLTWNEGQNIRYRPLCVSVRYRVLKAQISGMENFSAATENKNDG